MKLFDAIFKILIRLDKKLILGEDAEIYAIVSSGKPNETANFYLNLKFNPNRTYANIQCHPLRPEIEEYLTKIILDQDPRTQDIVDFLNANSDASENPLSNGVLISEILQKDHPETVRKVQEHSNPTELKNAALDLIIKRIKKSGISSMGYFNKEYYENLKYDTERNVFIYEEGDPLCNVPDKVEEFKTEEAFKTFIDKKGYVTIEDGIITGYGNPTTYISYWLKDMGFGSIRDYILTQKNRIA